MKLKDSEGLGKFLLCFSIIASLVAIYMRFHGGNFIQKLNNLSILNVLLFTFTNILLIISGIRMKDKHPKYYKCQIIGASILLATSIVIDLIPRLFLLLTT